VRRFVRIANEHSSKFVGISAKLVAEAQFIVADGICIPFDGQEGVVLWNIFNEHIFQIIIKPLVGFGELGFCHYQKIFALQYWWVLIHGTSWHLTNILQSISSILCFL